MGHSETHIACGRPHTIEDAGFHPASRKGRTRSVLIAAPI